MGDGVVREVWLANIVSDVGKLSVNLWLSVLILSQLRQWRREVRAMKKWRIYIQLVILADLILYTLYISFGSTPFLQVALVYIRTLLTLALAVYSSKKVAKAGRHSPCRSPLLLSLAFAATLLLLPPLFLFPSLPFCRHPFWIAMRGLQAMSTLVYLYSNRLLQQELHAKNKQMLSELEPAAQQEQMGVYSRQVDQLQELFVLLLLQQSIDLFYLVYYLSIPALQDCQVLPMSSQLHSSRGTQVGDLLLQLFCDWSMRFLCFYLPSYKISRIMFQQRYTDPAHAQNSLLAFQHEDIRFLQGLRFNPS